MKEQIAHYRISCELGRGGMGVVYRAHEESLGRDVAIKVLGEHLAEDEASVERFVREARSAAALNHPNIVQIYAIGEEDGRPYFVMEYVDGVSLQRLLKERGRMDWITAARVVVQAASGLEAAHERGIIHRDIKPANLLLDRRGLVKIADFGLALAIAGATRLTATGMMMGTPGYLSPEQCRDLEIDNRTDIYSLGATFYEMLTGAMPFSADSPLGLIKKIIEVDPPDVRALNPAVDAAICDVLVRMMAKDRDQRYPSCRELIADLEPVLVAHDAGSATIPASVLTAGPSVPAEDDGSVEALPTVVPGEGLPPLPAATPVPAATTPASPATAPAEPPPRQSRALPLLLIVTAVLLLAVAFGAGAVVVWRQGLLARAVARFTASPRVRAASSTPSDETTSTPILPTPASPIVGSPAVPLTDNDSTGTGDEAGPLPPGTHPEAPAADLQPGVPSMAPASGGSPVSQGVTTEPPSRTAPEEGTRDQAPAVAPRGFMVLAVGDPLLADEAARYLEAALRRAGAVVVDPSSVPEVEALLGREAEPSRPGLRAAIAPHARHLVVVRATYLGERPLSYLGRTDTTYQARLRVTVSDLAGGGAATQPFDHTLEYNHLTVERVVATNLRPWLRRQLGPGARR